MDSSARQAKAVNNNIRYGLQLYIRSSDERVIARTKMNIRSGSVPYSLDDLDDRLAKQAVASPV
jgi:hypothetical protein